MSGSQSGLQQQVRDSSLYTVTSMRMNCHSLTGIYVDWNIMTCLLRFCILFAINNSTVSSHCLSVDYSKLTVSCAYGPFV